MKVNAILETCLYAPDLAAAAQFYHDILGLEILSQVENRHVFFRCGRTVLLIFNPEQTRIPNGDVPTHGTIGPGHVAFAIPDEQIPAWRTYLGQNGISIEQEVTWGTRGRSLYFRDPAGNSVELATPRIWGIAEEVVFGG